MTTSTPNSDQNTAPDSGPGQLAGGQASQLIGGKSSQLVGGGSSQLVDGGPRQLVAGSSDSKQNAAPVPVQIGPVRVGPGCPLVLIAGPCVIESREHTLRMAEAIQRIARLAGVTMIFKASFDKANRSSLKGFRGPGMENGLAILAEVRKTTGLPVVSDIHDPGQAGPSAQVLDLLQIPAFLCRQTDLLIAAGATGKPVNVKKGQFMAPEQMRLAVEKVREAGSSGVLLTERGTFFGYGRLVNDMSAVPAMARWTPVVFDATHSCQLPGEGGTQSGGQREMVPVLARAGVAAGAHALFLEVHDNPPAAKSDPATVWPLDQLGSLLGECRRISEAIHAGTRAQMALD